MNSQIEAGIMPLREPMKEIETTKKILIAAPIHESKAYIIDAYLENIKKIKEQTENSFKVETLFVDNSDYTPFADKLCLENKDMTIVYDIHTTKNKTSQERQCSSLNLIKDVLLRGDFDYLMIIESDILPNEDIIYHLIDHDKDVCSAVYWIGKEKKVVMITQEQLVANNGTFPAVFVFPDFINGELKEVPNGCGLGCILIKRKVLEKIKFRWGKNHADTYFHEDRISYDFKAFVDTSQVVKHYQTPQGGKQ